MEENGLSDNMLFTILSGVQVREIPAPPATAMEQMVAEGYIMMVTFPVITRKGMDFVRDRTEAMIRRQNGPGQPGGQD